MVKIAISLSLVALLSGCASLADPVGHEAAKAHGEHALRSLQNPNGVRF